jgi:Kef-type K+ transport system membrane component KefB
MQARGLLAVVLASFHKNWNHALPVPRMTGEGLFVILVIIAVVTTLMASPLFDRLVGSERTRVRPLREA